MTSAKRILIAGAGPSGDEVLKSVPGLYEDYIEEVGTPIHCTSYFFGNKEFQVSEQGIPDQLKKKGAKLPRNYVVDRNAIVAALSKYLKDKYDKNSCFKSYWNTRIMYVDVENKRALIPSMIGTKDEAEPKEQYISYDYLIGCDGIRSIVRSSFQSAHRDFMFDISDTFSNFKSVHIKTPTTISPNCVVILVESLPNITMIGCPQPGGVMNLMIGYFKNNCIADELMSRDVTVIAKYMEENLKAFVMEDYDDFADQWAKQDWSTTGQLHCSCYHSEKVSAILMGDAAHATSPTLSLGLNTAFCDVAAFNRLLDDHDDDWMKVLPLFSTERVKEGYALVELSFHLYTLSPSLQLQLFLWDGFRDFWWRRFPDLVQPSALTQCMLGYRLSEVYKFAKRMGHIRKSRWSNQNIQREYFEQSIGLS